MKKTVFLVAVMCAFAMPIIAETDNKVREMANETLQETDNKVREMGFADWTIEIFESIFSKI